MKQKILLLGSGGHCRVIIDLLLQLRKYEIAGLIDLKKRKGSEIFGFPVIGTDIDLSRLFRSGIKYCFIAVGSIGDPSVRVKLFKKASELGYIFPNLISPEAVVSRLASFGAGNYIAPGVIINAGARIRQHCIINTGAIVEHDCQIGDFAHLSPGAVLSGGVSVGNYSHIGSGTVVIQNVKIGNHTVIGAGSVVTKNVGSHIVAWGNPCKKRKDNE
ncbi:MAG: acetyltransferase [bacterium]|nr:acetyltransferase [bacterium]